MNVCFFLFLFSMGNKSWLKHIFYFPGKVSYNDIHIVLNIFFFVISIKKLKIELGRDGNEACKLLGIFSFSTFLWFSFMKWFEWRHVNQWSRKFRGLFCLFKKELNLDCSTTWKFCYYYPIWFRKPIINLINICDYTISQP